MTKYMFAYLVQWRHKKCPGAAETARGVADTSTKESANDDTVLTPRRPKGNECQCCAEGCGLFFTGETAFTKHWTRRGHVHPSEVGLVERERSGGPTWGFPQDPAWAERFK